MGRFVILLLSLLRPVPELHRCVGYWQRELKLQDWKIELRMVAEYDLDHGTLGDIEPNRAAKTAVMRIMHEKGSDLPRRLALADQRFTVVHEMVHLRRFADGDPGWGNEIATNTEANRLVRKQRRWLEWLAIEE
jgi:hypothetical protein